MEIKFAPEDLANRRVEIIQALMEKFPREVYPAHDLIWYAWYGDLDLLPALQQSFKARENAHPSDPGAVYWYGYSRFWDDAPEPFESSSGHGSWPPIFHELSGEPIFLCHASYEDDGNNSHNSAIAGNSRLAKQSLGTKASIIFKACPGTSTVPESMMIGANGLSRLIAMANSCPFISGMQ